MSGPSGSPLDEADRAIIAATQDGLPLTPRPFDAVGRQVGLPGPEVMRRMQRMQDEGMIRRVAAVPNHYRLGFTANGMSVWDVPDERIRGVGTRVGELAFVSHCYHRPRRPPDWPYNLFAMVHGRSQVEVSDKVARIAELLGDDQRGHEILYSTRLLKKAGLRATAGQ